MLTEDHEEQTPSVSPGNYSPVTVYLTDTLGAVFLGVLTVILLIGWMRSEARHRAFLPQKENNHE
jgi:hypothetical protein